MDGTSVHDLDAVASIDSDRVGGNLFPKWMESHLHEISCATSPGNKQNRKHRSIFISDVHLGTKGSKAGFLCDFLKQNDCDTLYLVGDIIDGWRMKKRAYWPQEHINVIRRILTRAKRGTSIVYVTGNHDDFLRSYAGMNFGNIHLVDEYVHEAPGGKKYWVIHGDAFDSIVCNQKWLALVGDLAYETLLKVNVGLNRVRHIMGRDYWSLSSYLKYKVKKAVNFISSFEETLADECKKRGLHGVICGHIHHPEVAMIDGIQYVNSGDWVESCSAVVEDFQGNMQIVRWADDGIKMDNTEPNGQQAA